MRALSYASSLPVTWQRWRWHHLIYIAEKQQTLRLYVLWNPSYCRWRFYIAWIGIFYLFCSCDLDLMTFIYELDPYSLEVYRMCKYELPTLRFSKLSYDRQIESQTRRKLCSTPLRGWSKIRKDLTDLQTNIYSHVLTADNALPLPLYRGILLLTWVPAKKNAE